MRVWLNFYINVQPRITHYFVISRKKFDTAWKTPSDVKMYKQKHPTKCTQQNLSEHAKTQSLHFNTLLQTHWLPNLFVQSYDIVTITRALFVAHWIFLRKGTDSKSCYVINWYFYFTGKTQEKVGRLFTLVSHSHNCLIYVKCQLLKSGRQHTWQYVWLAYCRRQLLTQPVH